ncbi:MAG TPA: hypothetical protein VHJ77_19420 [Vicinamibacterales bacterium]|nr:hypothetical protein [Vicinamibacterales bacterium]
MQLRSRFAVLAACTAWASTALAQSVSTTANSVRPARFDEAPVIDGRTDEAMWTQAARLDGFRRCSPATTSNRRGAPTS